MLGFFPVCQLLLCSAYAFANKNITRHYNDQIHPPVVQLECIPPHCHKCCNVCCDSTRATKRKAGATLFGPVSAGMSSRQYNPKVGLGRVEWVEWGRKDGNRGRDGQIMPYPIPLPKSDSSAQIGYAPVILLLVLT